MTSKDGVEGPLITEEVFEQLLKSYSQLRSPFKNYVSNINDKYCNVSNSQERREYIKEKLQSYAVKNKKEQETLIEAIRECTSGIEEVHKTLDIVEKTNKEIEKMKKGSIALVGQITTISKQRIYDPRTMKDVFPNVKISPDTSKDIDEKIKKLFIFE